MGKDKSSSKDLIKKEKKEKRSEKDGVKKSKKDKKSKLNGDNIAAAAAEVLSASDDTQEKVVIVKELEVEEVEKDVKPIGALVPFANPLADEKVAKKVLKGVKKAAKNKTLKRGVKEVVKALRKSPLGAPATIPGIVILAADISPMDVISHIPVLCEDHNVPYIFVTSRAELGTAGNTKRPTSVVMVTEKSGKKEKVDDEESREFLEVYQDLLKVVEKEGRKVRI